MIQTDTFTFTGSSYYWQIEFTPVDGKFKTGTLIRKDWSRETETREPLSRGRVLAMPAFYNAVATSGTYL